MSTVKRKIGINLIAGIGIAVIVIAALFASGLHLPNTTGTVIVSIKDATVELKELWITVSSIQIQNAEDGSWIDLTLDNDSQFDLLALTGDKSLKLSQADVGTGDYTKIRLDVASATAIYPDIDGVAPPSEELTVPPGHIDIIGKFTIEASAVTGLLIDIQPDITAIRQSGNFRLMVKMTVMPQSTTTSEP